MDFKQKTKSKDTFSIPILDFKGVLLDNEQNNSGGGPIDSVLQSFRESELASFRSTPAATLSERRNIQELCEVRMK